MPLANAFVRPSDDGAPEAFFPLDVYFCSGCSLVQLLDVIDPAVLFRNYVYVTGTSETMAAHNERYARTTVDLLGLGPEDLVVEVASNDGSLLAAFKRHGVRSLGIEPALNIAETARRNGIETLDQFFSASVVEEVRASHGAATAVLANNVLAHVDDPQDFLLGCKALLHEDGLVIIEVPYLRELLDRLEYDTIYHEHLSYFSVCTLARLCDAAGLSIVRIDQQPVHGGSLRMYAGSRGRIEGHAAEVLALMELERKAGLRELARYERFAALVEANRQSLVDLLHGLQQEGRTIAGYGAPAKGNTLLNYCGIDARTLLFTVDKNPLKVGLLTPGTRIPVLPTSAVLEHQPDYLLILAWNFAEEIRRQQQAYRERGGRFVVPLPQPEILP